MNNNNDHKIIQHMESEDIDEFFDACDDLNSIVSEQSLTNTNNNNNNSNRSSSTSTSNNNNVNNNSNINNNNNNNNNNKVAIEETKTTTTTIPPPPPTQQPQSQPQPQPQQIATTIKTTPPKTIVTKDGSPIQSMTPDNNVKIITDNNNNNNNINSDDKLLTPATRIMTDENNNNNNNNDNNSSISNNTNNNQNNNTPTQSTTPSSSRPSSLGRGGMERLSGNFNPDDLAEEEIQMMRQFIVNKDTGEIIHLDDIDTYMPNNEYSMFPTKEELIHSKKYNTMNQMDSDDESDISNISSFTKSIDLNNKKESLIKGKKLMGKNLMKFGNKMSNNISKISNKISSNNSSSTTTNDDDNNNNNNSNNNLKYKQSLEGIKGIANVKTIKKENSEFIDMKKIQEMQGHDGPIWTMKFSYHGDYLATAGQSGIILIWRIDTTGDYNSSVKSTTSTPNSSSNNNNNNNNVDINVNNNNSKITFLDTEPYRKYIDHRGDVIDISWNKDNFLVSASIDKSVKLWHIDRNECLHSFPHGDAVTAVDFHPRQNHLFVSGSFDRKLRVWNKSDGRVKEWAHAPEMITSACFSRDGSMALAGLYHGQVIFYKTDGMRYYTQIECRNRHGANKGGKKVTGLTYDTSSRAKPHSAPVEQLLVTTNDSRLRLFQTDDFSMLCKYKGFVNDQMQIKATFSEDGNYVISGSENGSVFIWNTTSQYSSSYVSQHLNGFKKDRNRSYESFVTTDSNPPIATCAIFAPSQTIYQSVINYIDLSKDEIGDMGLNIQDCINKVILTSDYDGKISVYQSHSLLNKI